VAAELVRRGVSVSAVEIDLNGTREQLELRDLVSELGLGQPEALIPATDTPAGRGPSYARSKRRAAATAEPDGQGDQDEPDRKPAPKESTPKGRAAEPPQ
jgi:hypothetical protein